MECSDPPPAKLSEAKPAPSSSIKGLTCYAPSSDDRPAVEAKPSVSALVGLLLGGAAGRRCYRLVVEGNTIVELSAQEESANAAQEKAPEGWLSMAHAANKLRHSYFWLSRRWRKLGLHPKAVGRVLFFAEADVAALIERQRPLKGRVGRPRRVVRVVDA